MKLHPNVDCKTIFQKYLTLFAIVILMLEMKELLILLTNTT